MFWSTQSDQEAYHKLEDVEEVMDNIDKLVLF